MPLPLLPFNANSANYHEFNANAQPKIQKNADANNPFNPYNPQLKK